MTDYNNTKNITRSKYIGVPCPYCGFNNILISVNFKPKVVPVPFENIDNAMFTIKCKRCKRPVGYNIVVLSRCS